ncbi:FKBP-type peptidyl-prolyl cis-trans isomerase [Empedobacter falsenii]|uniref:Peptidyl-prolyl cis-trans isomerase n=1 Tax=Empedobacter falsenii TaxID=343874 RepID=A0ABY8V9Q9_9FLAO|nr:FKBP-type peptidyl-prolyl cis-trans isomerase [Empedobacter falsenii]WIH97857.1 FKBP-type peptidyl-prolyl cis-trans isomerase [Empedobacter falsenii]
MKKVILFTFTIFALMSCDQKVIQYPVSYSNDDFMKRSQERGKLLYQEELQWFDEYMKTSDLKFVKTNSGFWISNNGQRTPLTANNGDYIEFEYQVTDLDNHILYSYNENKIQKIILGKTDIARGLHAGLQLIQEGENAKLLLPSFLAYGGYGDTQKIAPDTPIIMDVKVLKIKKH